MQNSTNRLFEKMDNESIHYCQKAYEKTLDFLITQNKKNHEEKALTIIQNEKNIEYFEEHNAIIYHFFQNDSHPKGIYRFTSALLYRAGVPEWSVAFSVADFDDILNDNIYLSKIDHCVSQPNLILLSLNPEGHDLHYTIEFNINTQSITEKGFHFPLGHHSIQWRDENSVWACLNTQNKSNLPDTVYLLNRGEKMEHIDPFFEINKDKLMIDAWRYLDAQGSPIDIIQEYHSFFHYSYYTIFNQSLIKLALQSDCSIVGYLAGFMIIQLKTQWQRSKDLFPAGSIVLCRLNKGILGEAYLLFLPQKHQSIECIETSKNFIFIHYLDQVCSKIKTWKCDQYGIKSYEIPKINANHIELMDQPWNGNIFYIITQDLIHPPILYSWDAQLNELCIIRKQKDLFNTDNIKLNQYYSHSKDGTEIPYFWCGKESHSETPTLIYCYGGFGLNQLPHYMPTIGKLWLEKGYAFVIANIRGGSELGVQWHQQAQRENKHKSIDDLISVIEDLHKKNKTTPRYTAIQGGSNGGLIVANAMLQKPDLISAVICEMPIIDMNHYHKIGMGSLWLDEYGNPDHPLDSKYLEKINPLNKVDHKQNYPNIWISTDLNDDRVHYSHALKFYYALQEMNCLSFLYMNQSGGHDSLNEQRNNAHQFSSIIAFLEFSLSQ